MRLFLLSLCLCSTQVSAKVSPLRFEQVIPNTRTAPALFNQPLEGIAAEMSIDRTVTEMQYRLNLNEFEYTLTVPVSSFLGQIQIQSVGFQYIHSEQTAGLSIAGMF